MHIFQTPRGFGCTLYLHGTRRYSVQYRPKSVDRSHHEYTKHVKSLEEPRHSPRLHWEVYSAPHTCICWRGILLPMSRSKNSAPLSVLQESSFGPFAFT